MALLSVTFSQFWPPRSFCPGGVLRVVLPLPGSPDPFRETGREQSKVVQMNNSSNIIYYATLLCPRHCSQHLHASTVFSTGPGLCVFKKQHLHVRLSLAFYPSMRSLFLILVYSLFLEHIRIQKLSSNLLWL